MSDVLKELQVALSLDTSDFSSNTKKMNSHINDMQAKFKAASQSVDNFENSFTGLNAKSKILEATIQKNETHLANLREELEKNKSKTESLKATYESAKTTYENNARALEELKNSGTATAEEINKLEKEVERNKKAFLQAESAYSRNEEKITKLGTSITKTETNLAKLNKQNEQTKSKLEALQNPVLTTEQKLQNLANKGALVESKMRLLSSQLGVTATKSDKLKVAEQNLASKLDLVSQKTSILKQNSLDLSAKKATLEGKARELQRALLKEEEALKQASSATDVNKSEVAELTAKVNSLKDKLLNTNREIENTTNDINKNNIALNNSQAEFNELSNDIAKTKGQLASLPFEKLSAKLDSLSSKMRTVGQGLTTTGSTLSRYVTMPIAALGVASVKASVDFEKGMSNVKAISGATGEDLEKLSEKAREMGKLTSKSAKEASEGLSYMALAGWNTEEMLVGLEPILRLSEAGNIDLAKASDLATDSLSAMGLGAKDLGPYLDVVAKTSITANSSIEQLLESMIEVGPVAKQLSIPTESLSSALAMLANNGVKGSEAGKAMSTILSRLAKPTKDVQDSLNALNIDLFDSKGNFKGLEAVLGDLNKAFAGLTEEQKLQHATSLAGKNYLSQFLMLVDSGDGTMQKYTESLKDANGTLNDVAETMKNNAAGNFERLKSAFGELLIVIGDKLVPHINNFVIKLTDMINKFSEMDPELQNNIMKWLGIAAAIGPVLVIVGKLTTGLSGVLNVGSLISEGLGKLVGKLATTKATTMATSTAINGAGAAASATGGIFSTLGPILTNPWVLAGVAVVGATAVIVNETKKQKENIEKMVADNKEAIHGLEKRYETLSQGVESSIEKIRQSNEEWMTPQAKANLVQDMKDIQNILNGGNGNAEKEIRELVTNIKSVWGNLTPEMKEETSTAIANMIETFVRDGSIMPEKAKGLIESIQKELGVELHLNMEGIENDLKLEGIYNRMAESIQKAVGWFGVNNFFGDIEDAARSIVSNVTKEFEGMENIDTTTFFTRITSQLKDVGATSSQQSDIIKNTLKPSLIETFGGEGAAKYIDNYINAFYSASEAPQALIEAIQYANREYPFLTLEQQLALDDMNNQLTEKLGVQAEIMSGSVQNMLSQNAECWAGMVGQQLTASENMEQDLTTFTSGAVAQIANMSDDLDAQMKAAEWFNTFITRLVETGSISTEQAQTMANEINGALNKEVLTTSKLDATQFDNGVQTSLNKINELTGKIANPSSLLDDKKFIETETSLKTKINELNKSKAKPEVIAEATQALSDLQLLKQRIDALYDKTVTIKEKRITEYQTVYSHSGYAGAGTGPIKPKTIAYTDGANDMMARATALTDDISIDYQISGGYYSRATSPNLKSPMEEAILKVLKEMANSKDKTSKSLTQNITINSPSQLSPREIARETRLAGQQLVRLY